ncbi:MAG: PorT family protein [Fluviicola sp.]|nr:PorT family protein [Fluviicola sp.]
MNFLKSKILIISCLSCFSVFGKSLNDSTLISRFRPGFMWFYTGIRPAETEKVRKYDRLIFDVTYSSFSGGKESFKNKGLSLGLNTSLLFDIPITKGNTISIGTGISHSFFQVGHNNLFLTNSKEGTTTYQLKDSLDAFKRSSLAGNVFSIPLELRFRSKNWKHVKFHLGGKVGYQANLYSKYIIQSVDIDKRIKSFYFPDVNGLVYSVHARIGIRNWALFGSYSINKMFSNTKSTPINTLQVGLSISLF